MTDAVHVESVDADFFHDHLISRQGQAEELEMGLGTKSWARAMRSRLMPATVMSLIGDLCRDQHSEPALNMPFTLKTRADVPATSSRDIPFDIGRGAAS